MPNPQRLDSGRTLQTVITFAFCAAVVLDMASTYIALRCGAVEVNQGFHPYINPAFLQTHLPYIWYLLMSGFMVFTVYVSKSINRISHSQMGLAVMVVPIIVEGSAAWVNIQNFMF